MLIAIGAIFLISAIISVIFFLSLSCRVSDLEAEEDNNTMSGIDLENRKKEGKCKLCGGPLPEGRTKFCSDDHYSIAQSFYYQGYVVGKEKGNGNKDIKDAK